MDKLDKQIREDYIRHNLIKWWDVNMLPADTDEDVSESDEDDINYNGEFEDNEYDDSMNLVNGILERNSNKDAFIKAQNALNDMDSGELTEAFDEDNATADNAEASDAEEQARLIYERLMREAAEDEAAKQAEIERAKAGLI